MAWTTPKNWTTGEMVTHTLLNTHVRDNMNETAPALMTTKGDLIAATAANALARQAVGADGDALALNSAQANGVETVTPTVMPSGNIGFFTGVCPTGWTEYTGARGRYITGIVTTFGTVGTALTDQEDKNHTHTNPAHTHGAGSTANKNTGATVWAQTTTQSAGGHALSNVAGGSNILPYIQLTLCSKD